MDYLLCTKWIFLIILIGLTKSATSQFDIYTPPIINVERNWRISEDEKIGSIIARVTAPGQETKNITFGLEPLFHGNYASSNIDEGTTNDKLPFRIDSETGVVYLNESLSGRGGENFFLYVTAYDGKLPAKNEVYVNIFARNDKKIYSATPPPISQPPTKNLSNILPPFYMLPGVYNNPQPMPPKPKPVDVYNNDYYPEQTLVISKPTNDIKDINNIPTIINNNNNNNKTNNDKRTDANKGEHSVTSTKLTPIKNDKFDKIETRNDELFPLENNNSIEEQNDNNNNVNKTDESQDAISVKAIAPVLITICGIFLIAAVIVLVIYRKYLCAIGKSLKKKSKEEMAKKSNQSSNISSNDFDDSRNSMVLQHWNGPLAFNNRYVPWERDNQQATSQLSTSDSIDDSGNGGNTQSKMNKWEFPRHRLKFFNILGEGAFGQVWRCEASDIDGNEGVSTVAVKTLKENASEVERNDLYSELQVMKSLEPHINVIRLLGCCTDKDPIFVIIEYVNRGKLQTYLRNSRAERHYGNTHGKSNILTSGDLTSFMYQVAKGMDYLTSRGIIHRDLAARNILITDDHTCKVADFGFARDVVTSKIYERKSEGKLPIRWMAIESLYDNIFSVKSDIWSFGILMWEIVTLGSTPYPGISAADVMRKVRDGYRLEKPEHCRRELYNIMYYCWAKDSNERPTFSEVVQMLDKLLHTEMDYIELERFPDHNYYNILNLSGEKL